MFPVTEFSPFFRSMACGGSGASQRQTQGMQATLSLLWLPPAKKLMVHGVCWFQWLIDWFKNKWDSQMTDWDETDSLWIWKYPVLHFIFDLLCFLLNLLVFHPRVAERSSISAFSSNAGSGPFEALISAWASLMAAFLIDSWVAEIGNRFLGISGSTRYFDQKIYGLRP